jgi:hypothetical protein
MKTRLILRNRHTGEIFRSRTFASFEAAAAYGDLLDDTGSRKAGVHLVDAEGTQLLGHEGGGRMLLEGDLWVGVQVPPPGGHRRW